MNLNILSKRHKKDLILLKLKLADFGLKPEDWQIKTDQMNIFTIENIETPEFCFAGRTESKKGELTWQRIYLKSV